MRRGGAVVGNLDLQANTDFLWDRDLVVDAGLHRRVIDRAVGGNAERYLRATALSERLFGQAQALNTLLLGLAWQAGPGAGERGALLRAIELNGTAVALNRRAFTWGRMLPTRPELAEAVLAARTRRPPRWTALIAARQAELVRYRPAGWPGATAAWWTAPPPRGGGVRRSPAARPGRWRRASSARWPTRTSTRSPGCTPPPAMASSRCSTWRRR